MILWVALFLLVVAISFVLALQSMRDYHEIPEQSRLEYGLYLIRKTDNFHAGVLDNLRTLIAEQGLIISIERLFKGKQAALTIFGPKKILEQFTQQLDLLELEDYSLNITHENTVVWEVGVKDVYKANLSQIDSLFQNLPTLHIEDQFLWQIILSAKGKNSPHFQTQIRAVVYSPEPIRRKAVTALLQNLHIDKFVKVPRPFSPEQMMAFYKLRSLGKDSKGPVLGSGDVLRLLKV